MTGCSPPTAVAQICPRQGHQGRIKALQTPKILFETLRQRCMLTAALRSDQGKNYIR